MTYEDKPSIDELMHYGIKRRSGRYPWGSGEEPYQHSGDFLSRVEELKSKGLTDTEIARTMKMSTTQFRTQKSLAKDERRAIEVERAQSLREKGYSLNQIAEKMGYKNDSSIRSLLNTKSEARMREARNTANFLREQVDKKGIIDIGAGVEKELNITREKLKQAVAILEMEGYVEYGAGVPQVTNPGKQTNINVLCKPGTEHKDIYDYDKIQTVTDYISYNQGKSFHKGFIYPESLDPKRMMVRYAEEGGLERDGTIEIRRGVPDISLGKSHYAQIRMLVGGTHYLKGMALYSDDMPPGVDVIFNTNKPKGTPALGPKDSTVLKPIKNDPENPFGSLIKEHGGQSFYDDPNGKYTDPLTGKKQSLSKINKRAEEGDWDEWGKELPSQFLSKQNISMIKKQLGLAKADKQAEFDEIMALTNPTVKKVMLKSFSDDCDAAAVHLKAAALPRQRYQVILPIPELKDNEIYAPNYENGEKVALVRYPHGGTFEIPILTVNNKHPKAKSVLGNALDAVGINSKVAERLSGADFDGDTVMVIPTRGNGKNLKVNVTSTDALEGLKDFDPKMSYPRREGMKVMNNTQVEMGKISNLITDMTLKGANSDELARAVRHSMVVIDAEKHKLDYKQSEIDNGIAALKKAYQGRIDPETGKYKEGASTLISQAKSQQSIPKRKGSPMINPETGEQTWKIDNTEYIDPKTGKVKRRMDVSTKMAETKDAFTLSSGTIEEKAYAEYANKMKSLANEARKAMVNAGKVSYSPVAREMYKSEVAHLEAQLNVALKNAPRERKAQLIANAKVKAMSMDNPNLTKAEKKKIGQQALSKARAELGAHRTTIKISENEWKAIQAGAITENKLLQIINNVDPDDLRKVATPRTINTISPGKQAKIKSMENSGYTNDEIAKALNLPTSTIVRILKGKEK